MRLVILAVLILSLGIASGCGSRANTDNNGTTKTTTPPTTVTPPSTSTPTATGTAKDIYNNIVGTYKGSIAITGTGNSTVTITLSSSNVTLDGGGLKLSAAYDLYGPEGPYTTSGGTKYYKVLLWSKLANLTVSGRSVSSAVAMAIAVTEDYKLMQFCSSTVTSNCQVEIPTKLYSAGTYCTNSFCSSWTDMSSSSSDPTVIVSGVKK